MAPQRLVRRTSLRGMAKLHEYTSDDSIFDRMRFGLIARTPTVLLDYLLECLLAVVAVFIGFANVTGIFEPTSLVKYLPAWLLIVYGALLLLGGATIIFGLLIRRFGTVLPMGLRLVGGTFGVYAIAVVIAAGDFGTTSAVTSLLVAGFALWRAFLLRSTYLLVSKDASLDFFRKK